MLFPFPFSSDRDASAHKELSTSLLRTGHDAVISEARRSGSATFVNDHGVKCSLTHEGGDRFSSKVIGKTRW